MNLEFISVHDKSNGYGVTKEFFIDAFKKAGIKLIDKFEKFERKDVSLVYSYPNNIKFASARKKVIFTMFETDKIPDDWVPLLKQADLVINPTKWGAEIFKRSGIDCKVVNLGFDDRYFKPFKRSADRDIFTFINYEAFTIRKGWHELFKAWQMAFNEDEPARMIFKTVASSHGMQIPNLSEYKNIEVINEVYTAQELNDLLKHGDCFVYPSRGEGFGIPPLEAMATGLPVIAPNQHAITEYFNPDFMIDIKTEIIPAQYDHLKGDLGNFVKCDVEDLAKALRYAYENRDQYRAKSGEISKYALNYTMKAATNNLVKVLKEIDKT